LAHLVEQLRTSVAAFKLRDNQNYYAPSTNISVADDLDNSATVSRVLRSVNPISHPLRLIPTEENLELNANRETPVPQPTSAFSLYPLPNSQSGNGNNG
jgi:hypothetical protein